MTETNQEESQVQTSRQGEPSNGQGATSLRLAEAFRQELDQVIQPVLETIRSQRKESTQQRNDSNGHETGTTPDGSDESPSQEPEEQPMLTLTIKGRQADSVMDLALDGILDSLFSRDLHDAVRKQSAQTLKAAVTASRKNLPKEQTLSEGHQELEGRLDDLLSQMFSDEAKAEMRQRGQTAIRNILAWNGPAARAEGEQALQALEKERLTALNGFWKGTLTTLLKASRQPAEAKPAGKSDAAGPSNGRESAQEKTQEQIPQTVLRSDKRAQDIWKKAYDKATGGDGQGSGAQRAAYDALKAQYEKKGDRWVKKDGAKSK